MSKLFSKENGEVFSSPLNLNNPIAVQVLGICSALAVTSQMEPAIVKIGRASCRERVCKQV